MPADNKTLPFMKGKNARFIFIQDRVPKSYAWKTWSLKPNVTKHNDGVNGEDRDRLDNTLNYYEITAQMYKKDAQWLNDHLAAQAAQDANTAPIDQAGAFRFSPNDGTRTSYILEELIWDDWDLNQGGRSETMMVTVNMRCTRVTAAKAV